MADQTTAAPAATPRRWLRRAINTSASNARPARVAAAARHAAPAQSAETAKVASPISPLLLLFTAAGL